MKKLIWFTFDVEEDWDPRFGYFNCGYNLRLGYVERIANALTNAGISGTFFISPKIPQFRAGLIPYLKTKGQDVGLHLHPHTLMNVIYPYKNKPGDKLDRITSYPFSRVFDLMLEGKNRLEKLYKRSIASFRSGFLLHDQKIIEAACYANMPIVSNEINKMYYNKDYHVIHLGPNITYPCMQKFTADMYKKEMDKVFSVGKICVIDFQTAILYEPRSKVTHNDYYKHLTEFINYIKTRPDVQCINRHMILKGGLIELLTGETHEELPGVQDGSGTGVDQQRNGGTEVGVDRTGTKDSGV